MPKTGWERIGTDCYLYTIGGYNFKLEYKPKEVRSGHFENHWLFSGSIEHTSWYEHILEGVSLHTELAQKKAERIIIDEVSRQMKYHLDLGNKFANTLSEIIRGT